MTTVHPFSMTRTIRLRQALRRATRIPHEEGPQDYLLESFSGWFRSKSDPEAVIRATEVLRLREAFRLRAYQYRAGGNGNGVVWALPVNAGFPPPELCETLDGQFANPPRPPLALDDFMDAIEGDHSSWSYLCASLVLRELHEYGAMWHGISWGTHELVCRDPWVARNRELRDGPYSEKEDWRWRQAPPDDWRPSVEIGDKAAHVRFFTFSALGQEAIIRHDDHFSVANYRAETETTIMGEGQGGYIF